MGVRDLWRLLEPSGRRADAESVRGKRVAVDASIWLNQFIKATRDEDGDVAARAHVAGFFRRIARLLRHGARPVFVFDGATPALKRRTTATRRRARERSAAKVRVAAEKVLLNELKRRALVAAANGGGVGNGGAVAIAARDGDDGDDGDARDSEEAEEEEEEEEEELDVFVPDGESIDPEVLGALPPSVRMEVVMRMRDKRVADNREHFAAASGKMQDFSALQLETYLKGTKLKREIDRVMQKSDLNDPMTSKRVAAQDNRDFIFAGPSSSNRTTSSGALALAPPQPPPSTSGVLGLTTGTFASDQLAGVRTGRRGRAPTALVAPQERFLVTNLHPTLPTPSVAKSVAETPIVLSEEPSTLDLQISFTTENIKAAAKDPLFASADDATAADEDEDDIVAVADADEEWEDVEDDVKPSPAKLALAAPSPLARHDDDVMDLSEDADDADDESHGDGTALKRKSVYSLSHGFLKGRSLGGWDADEEEAAVRAAAEAETEADVDAAIAIGVRGDEEALAPLNHDDESEQLQRAIAMSVATAREEESPTKAAADGVEVEAQLETNESEDENNNDDDDKDDDGLKAAIAMSLAKHVDDSLKQSDDSKEVDVVEIEETKQEEEIDSEEEQWIEAAREAERIAERARVERLICEAEEEQERLKHEIRQAKKGAEHVTDEMYRDVQELLTLFGIPYIIAPQEAEAQCAYLNQHKLVDAVITDDSDVFLFGASHVYRNFFSEKKYCEVYTADRIKRELGLDRDRFIQLALLLGSDYTEGVGGVGIVNALEIVSVFKGNVMDASKAFREWIDMEELTMVPERLLPSPSKTSAESATDDAITAAFKEKHRSLKKSWEVPANYPSLEVVKAYQYPSVDQSEETFEWGKPDLDMLRLFCIKTLSWTRDAADQILLPMMKSWSKRDDQRRIDSFFETSHAVSSRVAKFRSKRLGDAVKNLTNASGSEVAAMILKRTREEALGDVIVDYDDGQHDNAVSDPEPKLDDGDDADFADLDLSQYSSDRVASPSPKKPKNRATAKPKPRAKPKPEPKPEPKTTSPRASARSNRNVDKN